MDTYGLIGYPLGHSFSRNFFTDKFASEDIEAEYKNFEIPSIDDLSLVLTKNPNLRGLNVTIPYKEKVMPFLDEISKEARAVGAVNVIRVEHKGKKVKLIGYNSDVVGFTNSIEPLLKPHHKKALILGTGGASKAVYYALTKKLGMEAVYVSRYKRPHTVVYEDLDEAAVREYEVIVNCTPVGMFPHINEAPKIPYEALNENNLLFDLIYNPEETMFMQRGKEQGAVVKNGLEMLVLQALASWNHWVQ